MKTLTLTEQEIVLLNHVLWNVEATIISTYEAFFMDCPKNDKIYNKLSKKIDKIAKTSIISPFEDS